MKRLKRYNEIVGFDDSEMRDKLEIPNLMGEFEPDSPSLKPFSKPISKLSTRTEAKKITFRFPILNEFHTNVQVIKGDELISFYATSTQPINGVEFYSQLSFAYHNNGYFIGTVLRELEDYDDEEKWVKHTFFFEKIEETFEIIEAFISVCKKLAIIGEKDLLPYATELN
jgi:hypothetical protein